MQTDSETDRQACRQMHIQTDRQRDKFFDTTYRYFLLVKFATYLLALLAGGKTKLKATEYRECLEIFSL